MRWQSPIYISLTLMVFDGVRFGDFRDQILIAYFVDFRKVTHAYFIEI